MDDDEIDNRRLPALDRLVAGHCTSPTRRSLASSSARGPCLGHARRLGVARITVHRWEKGEEPTTGPDAYAIRSHAFFRLRGLSKAIEAAASAFIETKPQARKRMQRYKIEGASLPLTS